ncbi:MAG: metalloregulator ArsR/SmtB family transcription factor [Candidatus Glassbacteria bacterium]|nr:metalloregulator ArsR/SmtB family transcription factor [Candidatus Glassbacteria bacterium]
MFKALGEPTRLRLAVMLAARGECCVCHLAAALEEPDYKASRHLGVLRAAGLVKARREGTWMHYSLNETGNRLVGEAGALLRTLAESTPGLADDLQRLEHSTCGVNTQ